MDDTKLHIAACDWADNEAFRLYGTDSISCYHSLWPRWLKLYQDFIDRYFHG